MATKGVDPEENTTTPQDETNSTNETNLAPKAKDVRISFDHFLRAKKTPDVRGIMYVSPEEWGFDREEIGFGPSDRIGWVFRPLKAGENAEIRDEVKDFEGPAWNEEYQNEIIRRCSVEPEFPDSVEGRKALARMLPGTRSVMAQAVLDQSGMGLHSVKSAREELGKLSVMTSTTALNSV